MSEDNRRAFAVETISLRTVRCVLKNPQEKRAFEELAAREGVSVSACLAALARKALEKAQIFASEPAKFVREHTTVHECDYCHAYRTHPPLMFRFGEHDPILGKTEWFHGHYCKRECLDLAILAGEGREAFEGGVPIEAAVARVENARSKADRVRAEAFLKGYKKAMPPPEPPITATERARREREAKVQERHDKENAKARAFLRGAKGKPAPNPNATPAPVARKVPVIVAVPEGPEAYPVPSPGEMPKAWGAALEDYKK